jgi:hypothetical protein
MEPILTLNFPLKAGFLISDKNRADLDWTSESFTWRYRNKLSLERTVAVYSYHLVPYVAAEPYYVEKYHKWSTTDLYAGCLFPVGRHVQFNVYYEHENNTGKRPNQQVNNLGFALYLFFLCKGKEMKDQSMPELPRGNLSRATLTRPILDRYLLHKP